jgi:AsmA protein
MKYRFKKNKIHIIKMTAHTGGGKFNLNSIIDLSKPGYTYNLSCKADNLHVDEIINTLFPKAKDNIYGILSFTFKLSGAGTSSENIKRNLIGYGDFNIKNGRITNNKITENLSTLLGIDELKTINLKQASGTIKIRNSTTRLDSIFSSDDISMNPSGNIGFDKTLNLAFDLKLSPRLTDKALRNPSIASYIKDDAGWGRIPLKVSGTLSDPSYSVDFARAGKRIIKKKAKKLIEEIFKDEDKEKDKKQDLQKPLEDLLKGLFD